LQANAFEALGRLDLAIAVLDGFNQSESALGRHALSQYLAKHAAQKLCAQSAPRAEAAQRARGLVLASKSAGAARFAIVLTLVFFGVSALVAVILALVGLFGGAHGALGIGGLLGAVFAAIGIIDYRKEARARRLRTSGTPAPARVVHARGTGVWTTGVPQLLFRVLVLPQTGAPFLAHSMFHADKSDRARFGPGALVIVRMDPNDRGAVQFELD
jgi:hypothetical protein